MRHSPAGASLQFCLATQYTRHSYISHHQLHNQFPALPSSSQNPSVHAASRRRHQDQLGDRTVRCAHTCLHGDGLQLAALMMDDATLKGAKGAVADVPLWGGDKWWRGRWCSSLERFFFSCVRVCRGDGRLKTRKLFMWNIDQAQHRERQQKNNNKETNSHSVLLMPEPVYEH